MPPKVWIKLTSALTCVAFCGKGYTMRLEMGLVDIKNVRFGSRTIIDDHTLLIDRQELISLLAQEPLFDSIEIDLAHPGVKAALIIMERYPDTGITFVPANVNALVTPGLTRDPIVLPPVERVIGGDTLFLDNTNPDNTNPGLSPLPANQELRLWVGDIVGAISQVGASRLITYTG